MILFGFLYPPKAPGSLANCSEKYTGTEQTLETSDTEEVQRPSQAVNKTMKSCILKVFVLNTQPFLKNRSFLWLFSK